MTDKFFLLVEEVKGETLVDMKKLKKLPVSELESMFMAVDRRIDIYEEIAENSDDEEEIKDCARLYKHFQNLQVILDNEIEHRLNDIANFDEG